MNSHQGAYKTGAQAGFTDLERSSVKLQSSRDVISCRANSSGTGKELPQVSKHFHGQWTMLLTRARTLNMAKTNAAMLR